MGSEMCIRDRDLLENLIGSIANPRSRSGRLDFEPAEVPDFNEYFISFEKIVAKYEDLIIRKIRGKGNGMLQEIVTDLGSLDSVRCFFAALFLARDKKVELEQKDDDILITLVNGTPKNGEKHAKN